MDPVKAALERLDVAIDRLDASLDGYLARRMAERDELLRALDSARAAAAAAREKEAEARKIAETVSARLDAAIARLQSVLED